MMLAYRSAAVAIAMGLGLQSLPAHADWKPTRDVEFVIPFGPAGGADLLARTLIRAIEAERLVPKPLVAVNKGGGGTAVGVGYVKSSRTGNPETIVLINPQTQLTPIKVPGAAGWQDLTPVANIMVDDYLLIGGKGAFKDATALVADAKSKPPETLSIGSAGTADDLAIALFERGTGVKFNIVRFNSGAEALTALLGGHVDVAAGNPLEFLSQIKSGDVQPLGLFRNERHEALPDVPTLKEQGLIVEPFQMWRGIAVPKNVPPEAVAYWAGVFERAAKSPLVTTFIKDNLGTLDVRTGPDFVSFLNQREADYRNLLQPGTK
jgi:putative tricarboxylic transport membrane protein